MSNNSTTPADLTVVEQWLQYIVFYIGFGTIGAVGNVGIAFGILRSKSLRSRFFIVVLTLVFVRITIAYQFIATGLYRALKTMRIVDAYQKRITCHLLHVFIPVSFTVELALMVVLVVDRMLAIVAPLLYKKLTRRQAKIVSIGIVFVVGVLFKLIPSFVGWNFNEVILCNNAYSAPSPKLNLYFQNSDLPLIALVLFLYCLLWVYVKLRIKKLKSQNSIDGEMQLRRRMAVLPLLRNVIFAHSAITLTAKMLASLITYFPEQSIRLTAYSGNLNTVDLIINVGVLLWSNRDLREATVPKCCRNGQAWNSGIVSNDVGNVAIVVPMKHSSFTVRRP